MAFCGGCVLSSSREVDLVRGVEVVGMVIRERGFMTKSAMIMFMALWQVVSIACTSSPGASTGTVAASEPARTPDAPARVPSLPASEFLASGPIIVENEVD